MKLVTQVVHTHFVQGLTNIDGVEVEGIEVDGAVESVVQTIDDEGIVQAQVIFFADGREPQYMIDNHMAWAATMRAAQARLAEQGAVLDAVFPKSKGIAIDG